MTTQYYTLPDEEFREIVRQFLRRAIRHAAHLDRQYFSATMILQGEAALESVESEYDYLTRYSDPIVDWLWEQSDWPVIDAEIVRRGMMDAFQEAVKWGRNKAAILSLNRK